MEAFFYILKEYPIPALSFTILLIVIAYFKLNSVNRKDRTHLCNFYTAK